jgi:hypothetical protein
MGIGVLIGTSFPGFVRGLRGTSPASSRQSLSSWSPPGLQAPFSNFFELAVAAAIALYGPGSGAALATAACWSRCR